MSYNPPMKEQILHYFRNLYYEDKKEYEKLSSGLDKLVEETKNKQWIPCSERMPEIGQECLWTVNKEKHPDAPHDIILGSYLMDLDYDIWKDWCIAWQPLPEPFQI